MASSKQYPSYSRIVNVLAEIARPFVRIEVQGLEYVPSSGAAILVLNHISILDPVLVGVAFRKKREIRALAKESLFRAPLIGKAMKNMGHIPVHRGGSRASDSLKDAVIALNSGELVGIYPEGTVPPVVGVLGEFKSGTARLAIESGALVIPVTHFGAHRVMPKGGKRKILTILKSLFTRPIHRIVIGEPLGTFAGDVEDKANVAEVTEAMRSAIDTQLQLLVKSAK